MIDAAHDEWLTEGVPGRRVVAWLVDAVLILVAILIMKLLVAAIGVLTLGFGFVLLGLIPLLPFVYVLGFLISDRSATPGQIVTGIVLRRNDDLAPADSRQHLVWTVGLTITIIAGMIWMLVALLTIRHRTFHDLASGLVVVRTRAIAPRTGIWTLEPRPGRPFA